MWFVVGVVFGWCMCVCIVGCDVYVCWIVVGWCVIWF